MHTNTRALVWRLAETCGSSKEVEEEGGGNRGSWLLACFGRGAVSDCESLLYGVTGLLLLLLLPPTVVRGSCCCADVKWRRRRRVHAISEFKDDAHDDDDDSARSFLHR